VKRRIQHDSGGMHLLGDVNAVLSVNTGEGDVKTTAESRQRTRVRQRSSRTGIEVTDQG